MPTMFELELKFTVGGGGKESGKTFYFQLSHLHPSPSFWISLTLMVQISPQAFAAVKIKNGSCCITFQWSAVGETTEDTW